MKDKNTLHEGHRLRLKNRFLESGLENFEDHNILEFLLFYSIPRKDTNEIAHQLLEHFGSFKNVFDADFEELIKVDGIKESSATLIKLISNIARKYALNKYEDGYKFNTAEKIGEYFLDKYIGETREIVYVMLLNNSLELLNVIKIHEGSVNSAMVSPRKIMDLVVKYNASMVVLAHNHPGGSAVPSPEDVQTTYSLLSAFNAFDVKILEHYVISNNDYYTIIHSTEGLRDNCKANRDFFRNAKLVK